MYRKYFGELRDSPFIFAHKPRGWTIQLGFKIEEGKKRNEGYYTLEVNGVEFSEMAEAPPRQRAALARTPISMKMDGIKK